MSQITAQPGLLGVLIGLARVPLRVLGVTAATAAATSVVTGASDIFHGVRADNSFDALDDISTPK